MTKSEREMLCKIYYKYPEQTEAIIKRIDKYLNNKRIERARKEEDEFYKKINSMSKEEKDKLFENLIYWAEVACSTMDKMLEGGDINEIQEK